MNDYKCRTWEEYVEKAMDTCLPQCDNAVYGFLETRNEMGEVFGKIKKWIRKDYEGREQEFYSLMEDELGDVLWGVACLYSNAKKHEQDIAKNFIERGYEWSNIQWCFSSEVESDVEVNNRHSVKVSLSDLLNAVEQTCDLVKLSFFPIFWKGSDDVLIYRTLPRNFYSCFLYYFEGLLHRLSGYFDYEYVFDIEKICERNVEKLQSRKKRNCIQGDGDSR